MEAARREELLRGALHAGARVLLVAAVAVAGAMAVKVARNGLRVLWRHAGRL
ncbi:MAG: hypothetical protein HY909_23070 [Deltaproteobacteria bacterium]|jgi:hypothetical protein|nr:hypothetical protein [Deltaproteobacteria bacterium]